MLGALLSACPRPIAKSFGPDSERIHREHMSRFYPFEQQAAGDQTGRAHAVHEELLSNFSALELYQHWLDRKRAKCIGTGTLFAAARATDAFKQESDDFCLAHFMGPSAVRDCVATVSVIMGVFFRYRPYFLNKGIRAPSYARYSEHLPHKCLAQPGEASCCAGLGDHGLLLRGSERTDLIKLVKKAHRLDVSSQVMSATDIGDAGCAGGVCARPPCTIPPCTFFKQGRCTAGEWCKFSHDIPVCHFYLTGTCRRGHTCPFSHNDEQARVASAFEGEFGDAIREINNQYETLSVDLGLSPFVQILLVGEGDFSFAVALAQHWEQKSGHFPYKLAASCLHTEQELTQSHPVAASNVSRLRSSGAQVHYGWDATVDQTGAAWNALATAEIVMWNFPFSGIDEDDESNASLLAGFFQAMSRQSHQEVVAVLSLCNDQFIRWKVLQGAHDSFFDLCASGDFDFDTYHYEPIRNHNSGAFVFDRAYTYTFRKRVVNWAALHEPNVSLPTRAAPPTRAPLTLPPSSPGSATEASEASVVRDICSVLHRFGGACMLSALWAEVYRMNLANKGVIHAVGGAKALCLKYSSELILDAGAGPGHETILLARSYGGGGSSCSRRSLQMLRQHRSPSLRAALSRNSFAEMHGGRGRGMAEKESRPNWCGLCGIDCGNPHNLKQHTKGGKHMKKMRSQPPKRKHGAQSEDERETLRGEGGAAARVKRQRTACRPPPQVELIE
jgi:hypothetical protein